MGVLNAYRELVGEMVEREKTSFKVSSAENGTASTRPVVLKKKHTQSGSEPGEASDYELGPSERSPRCPQPPL